MTVTVQKLEEAVLKAEQHKEAMTRAYNDALLAQSACNLSGLVFSFERHMHTICEESRLRAQGTDWRNTHPVVQLFVTQLLHLSFGGMCVDTLKYAHALEACVEGADEHTCEVCGFKKKSKEEPVAVTTDSLEEKPFEVVEHFNGFELVHKPSGLDHWLSDGVDVLYDEEGHALSPGSEKFRELWEEQFNSNVEETLEAYFPILYHG